MNHEDLKVAVCQMTSIDEVSFNIGQIEMLARSARSKGAEVAFFPENCLFMRVQEGANVPGFQIQDEHLATISNLATELGIYIHLGSIPLQMNSQLYNSSVLMSPSGECQGTYQKLHLFDIALEGQAPIRESDIFTHGKRPHILEIGGWKIGETICYDVRFSEIFLAYAKQGVEAVAVPSAFLVSTGRDHWEILLRARAIECQCYVIAAAQAGVHRGSKGGVRETYGHSMVVDPWGKVLVEAQNDQPQVLIVELERQKTKQVRKQIPMNQHRRL